MHIPIVTVTLNPALDLSAPVLRVVPGPKLRTGPVIAEPGGGGINVARVVAALGGRALALACLGGSTGDRLAALLADVPGLTLAALPSPGETRESLTVDEGDSGAQFRFVLPGPDYPPDATAPLLDAIAARVPGGALVVLSGSQPPGLPDDLPRLLAQALPAGARLIVDTSGPPLAGLIARPDPALRPAVLRLDAAEAEAHAGTPLPDAADSAALAARWVAQGVAETVILARGAEGSVMVGPGGAWLCVPPRVTEVSKVGAGDSFVAGLTLGLARGDSADQALTLAVAAAAAAVTTPGTQLCRAADVAALRPACRLQPL